MVMLLQWAGIPRVHSKGRHMDELVYLLTLCMYRDNLLQLLPIKAQG